MTVYIGTRDLNGLPIGTHQFIVITSAAPQAITIGGRAVISRTLGRNIHGIVIGAQNRGMLKVEAFEIADTLAAQEHFGGTEKRWYKSDYDTELHVVKFNGASTSFAGEKKLISLIDAYITNQTLDPIKYPTAGMEWDLIATAGLNQ